MREVGNELNTIIEHDDDGWIWVTHRKIPEPYKFGIPPDLRTALRDEINESLASVPDEDTNHA